MASVEHRPLLDGAPLSLDPEGEGAATEAGLPVLLLLGDGPEARALARLAAECGFAVDMAVWDGDTPADAEMPPETRAAAEAAEAPDIPGLRRYLRLAPGESAVAACAIGRRHFVCIFPGDDGEAAHALEDVLASRAFSVGLWATREARERIWAQLREAGVPDAELAAVRCPLGLGDLADMGGPVASAVPVLAELLAARAGSRQRLRLED